MSGYDQCIMSCYYSGICKDYACVVYEALFVMRRYSFTAFYVVYVNGTN